MSWSVRLTGENYFKRLNGESGEVPPINMPSFDVLLAIRTIITG